MAEEKEIKRFTAKRKAELVMEIFQGKRSVSKAKEAKGKRQKGSGDSNSPLPSRPPDDSVYRCL